MSHPLQLSKDYVKIEDRKKFVKKTYNKRRKDRKYHATRDRFMLFHGKGDEAKGLEFLDKYWDRLKDESLEIIEILSRTRSLKDFGNYIKQDSTVFSYYRRNLPTSKRFWARLLIMQKIVQNFDRYEREKHEQMQTM